MEEGMTFDWGGFLLGILGLIFGGASAWLFTFKAMRRKADGESQQVVADSWKSVQDVYQQTIDDLNKYCEDIRHDRSVIHDENVKLREENAKLREKYNDMEEQIMELRKELARQGRKLESMLPFTCGLAACANRSRVEFQDVKLQDIGLNEDN